MRGIPVANVIVVRGIVVVLASFVHAGLFGAV